MVKTWSSSIAVSETGVLQKVEPKKLDHQGTVFEKDFVTPVPSSRFFVCVCFQDLMK